MSNRASQSKLQRLDKSWSKNQATLIYLAILLPGIIIMTSFSDVFISQLLVCLPSCVCRHRMAGCSTVCSYTANILLSRQQ